tara:strand:+ start:254 stop:574 length:321 start_codon:yes stop_codon:yes gene_type:complete
MPPVEMPSDVPEYPGVKRTRATSEYDEETWKRIRKDVFEQAQEDLEDATELFKMHGTDQIASTWTNRDDFKKHRDGKVLEIMGMIERRRDKLLEQLAKKEERVKRE